METTRKQGNRRKTGKEQCYTPPDTARQIIERIVNNHPELIHRTWIEPAGGIGTFIDAARSFGVQSIMSVDIEPHHPDIEKGDFLTHHLDVTGAVSIGNPPFGRNNSLSIPFFNKCALHSDVICFIVPRSWRKWSVINRLHRQFHLIDDYDLQINYLDVNGVSLSEKSVLRTVVQTWKRRDEERTLIIVKDMGLVLRTTPELADVSLTIFGYSCGTVKTEFERVKNTTQMFLKLQDPRAMEALRSVDFSRFFNNTAYTEALSIQEINYLLNEFVFGDPCLDTGAGTTLFSTYSD